MQRKWNFWLRGVHRMRDDLIGAVDDDDLVYTPGGANPALGSLLVDLAAIEESYIDSLQTLTQEFAGPGHSDTVGVESLQRGFSDLDARFEELFADWADDDFAALVSRPGGFEVSRADQFDIYIQAVLIVLAKIIVYLRAMGREVPASARDWIG